MYFKNQINKYEPSGGTSSQLSLSFGSCFCNFDNGFLLSPLGVTGVILTVNANDMHWNQMEKFELKK